MNVYAFYDFGLSAKPQCIIEAPDLESAQAQVAAKGLPLHRMTARPGVNISAKLSIVGYTFTQTFNSRGEALAHLMQNPAYLYASEVSYVFAYKLTDIGDPENCLIEPIEDIVAEFSRLNL